MKETGSRSREYKNREQGSTNPLPVSNKGEGKVFAHRASASN
jgi:hypothetical protein